MKVVYERSFLKDMKKWDAKIVQRCYLLISKIKKASDLQKIPNTRKMVWFTDYYRIRLWDYRLWCRTDGDILICIHLKHRANIYKTFP